MILIGHAFRNNLELELTALNMSTNILLFYYYYITLIFRVRGTINYKYTLAFLH